MSAGKAILDSGEPGFWHPDNWPGGRAPCQWRIERPSLVNVWLWVEEDDGIASLWSAGSYGSGVDPICKAIELSRELEQARDDMYANREGLASLGLMGATP